MESLATLFLASLLLLALSNLLQRYVLGRNPLPYPPGPRPDPLIGNFRHIPRKSPWLTYASWRKIYGDVISVGSMGKRIVVVNSAKAASEIFEKRGNIYSDRPHNVMIQELMKFDSNLLFLSYSERFIAQRKLLQAAFNPTAVVDYIPIQESEVYSMLGRILDAPKEFYKHIRRTSASIISTIGYGHHIVTDDDYYMALAEATISHLRSALQPSSFYVNLVPALKHIPAWFPFARFHRHAREGRELVKKLREIPFDIVKSEMAAGTAPHSYTSNLLEAKGSITGREDEGQLIQDTAAALYGAGSDSSMSSIITCILVMILNPDVQRRAQAELDNVLGKGRLPTIADKSSLPYINCIMLEVFRWQPVTSLGIPRTLREDDVYEGYFIPKGAIVMGNMWAISHDEELYEDPMRFWPERFDGRFPNIKDPRTITFGFGRRICPGRYLAANTVFIAIACLLSCFNFSKARDGYGKEEDPVVDYSAGPPAKFHCQVSPRSAEVIALIRAVQTASEA